MEHSEKFENVKRFYDRDLWNIIQVKYAVKQEWITAEEYYEITGDIYD